MYSTLYRAFRLIRPSEWQIWQYRRELERMQWWPRAELETWQLQKLQALVKYAYEYVPFYQERYRREGIHPADIKSLKDFQSLPFLTKEDIQKHQAELVSYKFYGKTYPVKTGGSTGQPTRFIVEDSFWRWNVAHRDRARAWYGVQPGNKMALIWGAPQDMPEQSLWRRWRASLMRHRVLNAFSLTEAKMQAFADMLAQWQPTMLKVYPSALALFAKFIKKQGLTELRPKLIETTAEKVTEPQRQLFQEIFNCATADCYSSREMATIAYQCPAGGLHVCETRYVEIIANGQLAAPDQLGEVIVTSLHQLAMPFIRYKIEDLGMYRPGACTCGRGLPMLQEIVGRIHDYLVTADGQCVYGGFFAYLFYSKSEITRYQVYQPDRTHLEVRLVCTQSVSEDWLADIRAKIQNRFGASTQISFHMVDRIELTTAGKHRYIISEVKPNFT